MRFNLNFTQTKNNKERRKKNKLTQDILMAPVCALIYAILPFALSMPGKTTNLNEIEFDN